MTTDLEAIGRDLQYALARRQAAGRRRSHRFRLASLVLAITGTFATVAYASGIGADLQLDPTKWAILGSGSVDGGSGAYVHAKDRADGSNSTFLVEHDAGLARVPSVPAAREDVEGRELHVTGPGAHRSRTTLQRRLADTCGERCAEHAQGGLRAGIEPRRNESRRHAAVSQAFETAPCAGLEYAGEQARLVYAGRQPASTLMPGART